MVRLRSHKEAAAETTAPDVYPTETTIADSSDHGLHVDNEMCGRCGREIKPTDEARRTAKGDCVHLSC